MTSLAHHQSQSSRKRKRPSSLALTLVDELTANITLGAHPLVKRVVSSSLSLLSCPSSTTPTSIPSTYTSTTTPTTSTTSYLPDFDVLSYLKYLKTAPKERCKAEDLERWRTDPIDLDELLLLPGNQPLNPPEPYSSFLTSNPTDAAVYAAMQPLDSTALQPDMVSNVLEINRCGILELKKLKDETALGCEQNAAFASNLAFGLRRRLLQLSFQVPKSEVTSRIQSTLPSSLPVSQSPTIHGKPLRSQQSSSPIDTRSFPDSTFKQTSGRGNMVNPIQGATVVSSSSTIPGIPSFSALPSDLPLPDPLMSASASSAGPTRCANCMTTDTPGWRAGEIPEMRLCNACGLYWAKNSSHRPPELWGSGKSVRRPHDSRIV